MDAFDYSLGEESKLAKNSQLILKLTPRLRASLLRHELPLPSYVVFTRVKPEICLHYTEHKNYRELSWLFRIYFGVNVSHFENRYSGTQNLLTEGYFPRHGLERVAVSVCINVGLRNTCHVEYEEQIVKVAKIICNEPSRDIEGVSIASVGGN